MPRTLNISLPFCRKVDNTCLILTTVKFLSVSEVLFSHFFCFKLAAQLSVTLVISDQSQMLRDTC